MRTLRLILILLLAVNFTNILQADQIEGNWVAKVKDNKIRLKLTIFTDEDSWGEWSSSNTLKKKDFSNLTFTKDSNFKLEREAGTINFNGQFKGDNGYGDFTFQSNNSFKKFLQDKKFEKVTDRKMLSLTLHNVTKKYVSDLTDLHISGMSTSKLISFTVHDISIGYIKDIQNLGYRDISASKLISFKVHDIDKDYIDYVKGLLEKRGKKLSAGKVISFKVQGI